MSDPSASGGAPIEKTAYLGCLHSAKHLLHFPKICPETILPFELPHKIAPKKILHSKSIFVSNQLLESLHPTHPLKIYRPLGSTCASGVPKFVSPAHENKVMKNRVARFPTKINSLKLKSNCWFGFDFWTAHGFDIYLF